MTPLQRFMEALSFAPQGAKAYVGRAYLLSLRAEVSQAFRSVFGEAHDWHQGRLFGTDVELEPGDPDKLEMR